MTQRAGLFPTFFLSGFECSTFLWKDRGRRNLAAETQHDRCARADYAFLRSVGIAVAREGIPWPLVDQGEGRYDFTCLAPLIEAMNAERILPVWDLCHYGYPDALEPSHPDFSRRFAAYCRAAAEHVTARVRGPHCFTPINEITFWGFAGGEWGWMGPFGKSREARYRLREALCEAAIAGVHAIREVDPDARMLHVEPLIHVVPPRDRPDLSDEARHEMEDDAWHAWDVLAGRLRPELGGAPQVLDIVGCNAYSFGQMEYRAHGPHQALAPDDARIVPLCELLQRVWRRYGRPMVISETSGLGRGRKDWLCDVMQESLAAVDQGIDLHGVCLFPAVDMPDWHTGHWLHNGLCDLEKQADGTLRRVPYLTYIDELRHWQRLLNRVTVLDEDPFSDPVDLNDVIQAAHRLKLRPDQDWT
ncbi:family 1 glycosylhydrolase [Azohydromonas caseinilytica]|uniref:Family 1 glycosylhydrolase n=1 Tax=Azohydromonas caseinilytica TaxID=2728836 RepID=A0A848FDQ9_9BURK|nr:family 1 glycosylhydrolase [Azohydromonas caseinilytica]NML17584.1 family 1 glycosylhydrolase [Azohydromonas caseinilytica]